MPASVAGAAIRRLGFRAMRWCAGGGWRPGRGRAVRSRPDAWHRAEPIKHQRLPRCGIALAFCTVASTAAAQAPAAVRDAVQRLTATAALEAPLRAAPCAFATFARHLDRLPSNVPWAQPAAIVLFDGLPGLPSGHRAVVLRPTRELLARAATRDVIAQGGVSLHATDLSPLPADAPTPAFLALHVPPPATPPEGCVAQPPR